MIYIDTRYAYSVSKKSGQFNGGNNYCRNVITGFISKQIDFCLICNNNTSSFLMNDFKINNSSIIIKNNFDKLIIDNGIYFVPLIDDSFSYYLELKHFKKNNPNMVIVATIHDRRHMANIFDRFNGTLHLGIKKNWIIYGVGRLIRGLYKDLVIKKIMKCCDKILTVSNYSMQQLLNLYPKANISYYNQFINFSSKTTKNTYPSKKILFVSAGRSEKNFIRALMAFEKYIDETKDNKCVIIATGLSNTQQLLLHSSKLFKESFLKNNTILYDYVSNDTLQQLYNECRFLLFTSKCEGYGLPIAEALLHGKPSVVSNATSMPEVANSCSVFVNPYSIHSIKEGIVTLMNETYYLSLLKYINVKKEILIKQMTLDNELFINNFFQ